jgi:queuine tRNA-ribosyltransferase
VSPGRDVSLDPEVVVTRSGAKAIRDKLCGELMHPVVGPAIEAERLYLGPSRLKERLENALEPLVLYDVGLGAGSNAIAAWRASEARTRGAPLHIVSFDRSLAAMAMALSPEHATAFGFDGEAGMAARAALEHGTHGTHKTRWEIVCGDLLGVLATQPEEHADVVYWDPFSPGANPMLWTTAAFATLRPACRVGATVHTYGGATASRAALLLAGFVVGEGPLITPAIEGTLPARNAKRGTIAALRVEDLERPLDGRWLERLERSSAPLPSDAPADAMTRLRAAPQFG